MPSLDDHTCRWLLAAADHGVLATAGRGRPHLVPIVYAVDGDTVLTAVDGKPKSTRRLARLDNIERDPACTLLVEHYEDDWDRLWWVRVDGTAIVDHSQATLARATELLAERYEQYADGPPVGPVVRITVDRTTGWAAIAV